MPQVDYPLSTDITSLLVSAGIPIPAGFDAASERQAMIQEWNRLTRYRPFLADKQDVERPFDPPGPNRDLVNRGGARRLDFGTGLISLTSITTGVTLDSAGSPLVDQKDFWLGPMEAPANAEPYTYVEFAYPIFGSTRSIRIVGKWGYAETIPDDAWQAMRKIGAANALHTLREGRFGGLTSIAEGDAKMTWDPALLAKLGDGMRADAMKVLASYVLYA